jgi:hypothetical protein
LPAPGIPVRQTISRFRFLFEIYLFPLLPFYFSVYMYISDH